MKNDFDFIKEKFESDGVTAPGDFGEREVLEQLQNVEPIREKKKSKAKIIGIASAAVATVAVVTAAAIAVTSILGGRPVKVGTPVTVAGTAKLVSFGSRDEVRTALDNTFKFQKNLYSDDENRYLAEYGSALEGAKVLADDLSTGSVGSMTGGASSLSHNSTYIRHTGVDEADTVKTDGQYIYQYDSYWDSIIIFEAKGKESEQVASIKNDLSYSERNSYSYPDYGYFLEYYLRDNKLIAVSQQVVHEGDDENYFEYEYVASKTYTVVNVYDLSDIGNISVKQSFAQSGDYCSSRMIGGKLYLVTTEYAGNRDVIPVFCGDYREKGATFDEVPAESVYSVEEPTESSFLTVSCIDTDSGQKLDTKSVLGSAENIYCNQDNLYVMAVEYDRRVYNDVMSGSYNVSWAYMPVADKTQLIKISLTDGLEVRASGEVRGRVNDQYSLDEFEGNLRVATTSKTEDYTDINNLFVLDGELNVIGEVTGFAPTESIKAVRYINSTAYVITYEQTDPLFVIDLSDPTSPVIAGEVKISGFSSMLVPIDDNTLLGIGYHTEDEGIGMEITEGIKLVTFDVSDKTAPKVLDTKVFKNYSSVVQYDPKALLVNFERNDYTIPYYFFDYSNVRDYDAYFSEKHDRNEERTGVINFRVDSGKIKIVDEYVSDRFGNDQVERCVYIGNTIYMLGNSNYDSGNDNHIDCVEYK